MRGGRSTPTDLRTFARNPTLPQEVTDVSIHDKGPGLREQSRPDWPALYRMVKVDFREFHFRNCLENRDSLQFAAPSVGNGGREAPFRSPVPSNIHHRETRQLFSKQFLHALG